MQGGILVNGRNAKSKAEVKRAIADNLDVTFYDTSAFNSQGSMTAKDLPAGKHVFVGPDPYTSRKFYGTIQVVNGNVKVS